MLGIGWAGPNLAESQSLTAKPLLRCSFALACAEHRWPATRSKPKLSDFRVDEGVIGALVALGPGVIIGGDRDGQRDRDHQQQHHSDAATSLPGVGLGLLFAHRGRSE